MGYTFNFRLSLGPVYSTALIKGKTLTFSFKFLTVSMSIFKWFRFLNKTHSGADGRMY
jgi:hypothetical protein